MSCTRGGGLFFLLWTTFDATPPLVVAVWFAARQTKAKAKVVPHKKKETSYNMPFEEEEELVQRS